MCSLGVLPKQGAFERSTGMLGGVWVGAMFVGAGLLARTGSIPRSRSAHRLGPHALRRRGCANINLGGQLDIV